MKRGILFICLAFSLILFTSILVSANVVNVNLDKEYNISLSFIDSSNARFIVNNQNTKSLSEQTSPYQFYPYYNSEKIDNLDLIVSDIKYSSKDSVLSSVEVILAYKVNISEDDSLIKINFNGQEYNISLSFIDSSNARFIVNNQNTKSLSEQTSPYQFYPYYNSEKIDNLDLIVSDIKYSSKDSVLSSVEVILAYKVNISEECIEDWSCTNWSSCTSNQQIRTCTDSNLCGTTGNKPVESQSCSAPTPDIECYSDDDCTIEGTGQPYCDGNKFCIPSMSYECKNDGTEESYCIYPETLDCTICENGCENSECIASLNPQPQKECEQIGLRQAGKYCSSQYKLISEKLEQSSCENNFECQSNICQNGKCGEDKPSNICQNGKCGEDKPSNLIYWIIGVIVVVILFVLIVYSITKKQ